MTRRTALLGTALLLIGARTLWAHEGHTHKTMGTVTMRHENHLEVKMRDGKTKTFTLNEKTVFLRAKQKLSDKELKVGDRVVVEADGKTPTIAKVVNLSTTAPATSATKK
jgi:hypothetical protein